jgi:hypothetical protein
MTHAEFMRWMDFYALRPFDDMHRYYRPAALVSSSFSGGKQVQERLDWLLDNAQAFVRPEHTAADRQLFAAMGIKK